MTDNPEVIPARQPGMEGVSAVAGGARAVARSHPPESDVART